MINMQKFGPYRSKVSNNIPSDFPVRDAITMGMNFAVEYEILVAMSGKVNIFWHIDVSKEPSSVFSVPKKLLVILYYRVMHPVARNIKLQIIPSFATIDNVFLLCTTQPREHN
jgi:hypothetical protein